jgi:transposase InsO family protein
MLCHAGWTASHVGLKKTMLRVRAKAYWTGWKAQVEKVFLKCGECARYFRGTLKKQAKLQTPLVGDVFEKIAIDITGPHPKSRQGYIYILTVVDTFSKWALAFPIRNHHATTVAEILSSEVFAVYGAPQQILSDRGPEFESQLMTELCILMEISKLRTTAYKPSTNGQVERFHRTLNNLLGRVVAENQRDWSEKLPYVMAAYRASVHESTGFTPNRLMFGREVSTPIDLVLGRVEKESAGWNDFVDQRASTIEESYELVRKHLGVTAEREKRYYDAKVRPKSFPVGTWVYYYYPRRRTGISVKWQRSFCGPFLIVAQVGPVNVRIQKTRRSKPFVVHIDKLKRCEAGAPVSWLSENESVSVSGTSTEDLQIETRPPTGIPEQTPEVPSLNTRGRVRWSPTVEVHEFLSEPEDEVAGDGDTKTLDDDMSTSVGRQRLRKRAELRVPSRYRL